MYDPEIIKYAQGVITQHQRKIKDADALAEKARIIAVRATSAQLKRNRELCATGLNDILERRDACGLLADPELRSMLLKVSKTLNTGRKNK